jgi:ketosteroid isomerase-like protein
MADMFQIPIAPDCLLSNDSRNYFNKPIPSLSLMQSKFYIAMKRNVLLPVLLLVAFSVNAQSKDEKDVAAAVEVLRKAMLNGDRASLENITADQLTYGHSSGKMEDKAAFVEALASGKSDFVTLDLTEHSITVMGNTALVRHKLHGETNDNGKPGVANIGIFQVWIKEKGAWKLAGRQAFKL